MNRKPVIVVIGGQWGSESKGEITGWLAKNYQATAVVRTGGPNAGHTVHFGGRPYKMQQLPSGWVYPEARLILGPGAYINKEILDREVEMINAAAPEFGDVRERLWIDYRAGLHTEEHKERAGQSGRHYAMGATGEGLSEAVVERIRARSDPKSARLFWHAADESYRARIDDTEQILNDAIIDGGGQVIIEGTQGTHLDLLLGPYPYTTCRMTSAAAHMAECGLSPALDVRVVLVVRTMPIRVAGNSGPMPGEISWIQFANRVNERRAKFGLSPLVDPGALIQFEAVIWEAGHSMGLMKNEAVNIHAMSPEWKQDHKKELSELHRTALGLLPAETVSELGRLLEFTTVTKKLRRLACRDDNLIRRAIAINRPSWVALTFLNYALPELWDETDKETIESRALVYVRSMQKIWGVPINLITTGRGEDKVIPIDIKGD